MQQPRPTSLCIVHSALCIALALAAASATARTVSITDTHYADGVASSFDLAIGAGEKEEGLYMAYGNLDGGDDINAWENVSKVADIPAATTTYAVSAPAGWGTSVTALRFFMATVADLPYEVQYEYIYSTGREYADTGYLATDSTKAAIDMAFLSCAAKATVPVFGYRKTANADAFIFFIRPDQDKFYFEYNRPQANVANVHIDVGERFTFRNDNSDMYLARFGQPEQLIATGEPMDPFTAPAGFSILINGFKKNTTTSVDNQNLAMRIYGFRIWEGNELVRDYVPARKDGVVGLYDKVGGSMLGANIGATRSFANGPVAVVNGGFVSSSAAPSTVFALGAPIAGSARRNVAIAETNRVAGAIVSLGPSPPPSPRTTSIWPTARRTAATTRRTGTTSTSSRSSGPTRCPRRSPSRKGGAPTPKFSASSSATRPRGHTTATSNGSPRRVHSGSTPASSSSTARPSHSSGASTDSPSSTPTRSATAAGARGIPPETP